MTRTLADFAASGAALDARLRVARGIARAVAALHRRGAVHGGLSPAAVLVAGEAEAVALAVSGAAAPLALAGWAAPELIRGARPTRRSDAFAAAALAQLALTGRGPFDGGLADGPERARRALFEPPRPARLDEPALPPEVEDVLARLLERRARRRGTAEDLEDVFRAVLGGETTATAAATSSSSSSSSTTSTPTATSTPTSPSTPTPTATATATATAGASTAMSTYAAACAKNLARLARGSGRGAWRGALRLPPALAAALRRIPPSPLHRAAIAAAPILVGALLLYPRPDAALTREVDRAIARGDLAAARSALDAAPRGADRAIVEKLRGDLACARRAPDECLRRYRTALAARPALRSDGALRHNVRALLSRDEGCSTRRAAALLAGELRDPGTLPALQAAARQSRGLFAYLCTGDAFDRAIAATRGSAR